MMIDISKSFPLINVAQNNHRAKRLLLSSGFKTWTDDEECFGLEFECLLPEGSEFTRVTLWGDLGVPLKLSNKYMVADGSKDGLMVIIGLTAELNGLEFEDALIYTRLDSNTQSLRFPLKIDQGPTLPLQASGILHYQVVLKAVTDCELNSAKTELFMLVTKLNYCFKLLTSAAPIP